MGLQIENLNTIPLLKQRRVHGKALALIGVVLAVLCSQWGTAWADGASANREYQVKAAFITKFLPFIEWPADSSKKSDAPLVIGVVNDPSGRDPFDDALDKFATGKSCNGRSIAVRHVQPDADVTECDVLFIPASQDGNLKALLKAAEGRPILTVGESDAFPWAGGSVRFYLEDNKVRFEVSLDALKASRISASSKFLALGKQFKK